MSARKKAKPKQREPDLMDRTRAAIAYCNAARNEELNMFAFLQLFHPEITPDRARQLSRKEPRP